MTAALPAPDYRLTIAALAVGQIVCWAVLFYAFTAFVLPMQREFGGPRSPEPEPAAAR